VTTNFGLDLSSLDDVDETREVTGIELVAQDAVWRLKTPRAMGILEGDAPDYGFDLLEAIGSAVTPEDAASLPDRIRAELTKEERILTVSATVTASTDGPSTTFNIMIRCETAEGPFELVGLAGDETLDLAVKLLPGGIE
jgi:hypothetical protein